MRWPSLSSYVLFHRFGCVLRVIIVLKIAKFMLLKSGACMMNNNSFVYLLVHFPVNKFQKTNYSTGKATPEHYLTTAVFDCLSDTIWVQPFMRKPAHTLTNFPSKNGEWSFILP